MEDSKTSNVSKCCKLHSFDALYSSDAVEWCPVSGFDNILLTATYQLCKPELVVSGNDDSNEVGGSLAPQTRHGGLVLLGVSQQPSPALSDFSPRLNRLHTSEIAGVLDVKWCHGFSSVDDGQPLFAAADSNGDLSLWSLKTTEKPKTEFQLLEALSTDDNDALALSLDWSTAVSPSNPKIVISNSAGVVTVVDVTTSGLIPVNQWQAHNFEAWIAAFNYHNPNIVYSGGDDCKLQVWDVRSLTERSVATSTSHSMGVCSIQSNPHKEHVFASGSYDEHILVWDSRKLDHPVSDTAVGGGVWRVKWSPFNGRHLLAACMHNGAHIIDYQDASSCSPQIVASYMEHQSLVYGVDWSRCRPSDLPSNDETDDSNDVIDSTSRAVNKNSNLIASCSFYDCQTHVWSVLLDD